MVRSNQKKKSKGSDLIVFAKSFDNGEVLRSGIRRSSTMQYVVRSFSDSVQFDEYVVVSSQVNVPVVAAPLPARTSEGPVAAEPKPQVKELPVASQPQPVISDKQAERAAETLFPVAGTREASSDAEKLAILDRLNPGSEPAKLAPAATAASPAQSATEGTRSQQSSFSSFPASQKKIYDDRDDDSFLKDMQTIMRGEKLYNNENKVMESRQPKPQAAPPQEATALSQMENKQAIFDQIAESMSYAKAYDLGDIDIVKRFSDFDKIAASQAQSLSRASQQARKKEQTPVSSESFLLDLNAITTQRAGQGLANTTKKEYVYRPPEATPYSYMKNPALIAGIEIADAIQIGLGAVSVAQASAASVSGGFSLSYEKAQRLLTSEARASMPGSQTAKQNYKQELLWIGELKKGFADASIIIEWEGNAYGEIGTPVISRDLDNSTDWTKSSCRLTVTRLDKIPQPGIDPRAWPIVFHYEGEFNPAGNGKYEFDGEFEINAFGGLTFNRHRVVDRSLIEFLKMGEPEEYVRRGRDTRVQIPEIPAEQLQYLKSRLP